MGVESLKMSYDDMETEITNLSQYADAFEQITASMTTSVNTLCDGWTSASTETYRDDYTTLTKNFSQTLGVVRQLIASTTDYIAAMQSVDDAYSKPKVTTA